MEPLTQEPQPQQAAEAPATAGSKEPRGGVLYLVGTPIGNLEDLSPRARRVLAGVDRIACEDTRHSGLLLARLEIRGRPLLSFHAHNANARLPALIALLEAGESLALISDAGLPGISDPGETLVAAARERELPVICIPGPCALTTALVSSGLPCSRFCFEGFLPPRQAQRLKRLEALAAEERTLVFYEAPHRLVALLEDLLQVFGDRPLRVARELTKCHEEQVGATVSEALARFRIRQPQGECTVVVGGAAPQSPIWDPESLRQELQSLRSQGLSSREASRRLAERTGHGRRELYALLHDPAGAGAGAQAEGEGEIPTSND